MSKLKPYSLNDLLFLFGSHSKVVFERSFNRQYLLKGRSKLLCDFCEVVLANYVIPSLPPVHEGRHMHKMGGL